MAAPRPDQYNESVSYQTQRQRVLSPGEIAKLPPGQGLLLRGREWQLIGLTTLVRDRALEEGRPDRLPERLIHSASDGTRVMEPESELVVLETLLGMGLEARYEQRLFRRRSRRPSAAGLHGDLRGGHLLLGASGDARSPDSMLAAGERKRDWYERNGFVDRLITSADAPGGGLSVPEVKARADRRILRGEPRLGEPGFDSSAG